MAKFDNRNPKRIEKLTRAETLDLALDLINAFRIVKTPLKTSLLIQDLLTASEIRQLSKRLRIAKLILAGETHRDIAKRLHCSLATITKVNQWLSSGGEGLREVISKLPKRYVYPQKLPGKPIEFQLPEVLETTAKYVLTKNQEKQLEKFTNRVEDKKVLDRALQKMFDEQYRKNKI